MSKEKNINTNNEEEKNIENTESLDEQQTVKPRTRRTTTTRTTSAASTATKTRTGTSSITSRTRTATSTARKSSTTISKRYLSKNQEQNTALWLLSQEMYQSTDPL